MLAVVARGGQRGAARGKLLSLLWPDADDTQGRRVVTQALYALRRDLQCDDAIVGTQDLRLNRDVVWSDIEEFDLALSRGEAAAAVAVYVGPFLEGFRLAGAPEFERWADDERSSLQHRLHVALESMAADSERRGAMGEAVTWWRRRAATDPLNSRVAIALMRALVAAGDRNGAIRHAAIFEALMAEELGLPTDREVKELADSIRREAATTAAPAAVQPAPVVAAPTSPDVDAVRAIAVLPFSILGPNRLPYDDRPWCDHLAEELITALLELPLRVVARSASFALGENPGLATLRGQLGVSHAIEGSIRRVDAGLRVNIRLVELTGGHAVCWERFDISNIAIDRAPEDLATRFATRIRDAYVPNQ
jgi:DNA-binding SARP family transcriptional activator